MGIYLNDWENSSAEDVFNDFDTAPVDREGIEIVFATYTYEDYMGDAFVLFVKSGALYEVNGSHCSCYGLEGQWEPEETTLEALSVRDWESYGVTFKAIKDALL